MLIPDAPRAGTRLIERCLLPERASPARRLIQFVDGDVVLRSADGHDFRVHSIVLRKASLFFREMFSGSRVYGSVSMTETTDVLNDILRWLYPVDTAPNINSTSHALDLLRAVERLQIDSHVVKRSLHAYIIAQPHPLCAWALATRFGYMEARKDAARRCLATNEDFIDDIPTEMELVDAKTYMKLIRIKRSAIDLAIDIIRSDVWDCPHLIDIYRRSGGRRKKATKVTVSEHSWRPEYFQRVSITNPFEAALTSNLMIEMYVSVHGRSCCREKMETQGYERMNYIRSRLAEILTSAAEAECSDGIFPHSLCPDPDAK